MVNKQDKVGLRNLVHSHTGKGTSILKRLGLVRLKAGESYCQQNAVEDTSSLVPKIVLCLMLVCSFLIMRNDGFGQANRINEGDVTCPATGTSIQVMAANSARYSYLLNNINGQPVRIGHLASGTAALSSSTGWVLQPGQAIGDSAPNVVSLRIVCMSTTATSNIITYQEAYR